MMLTARSSSPRDSTPFVDGQFSKLGAYACLRVTMCWYVLPGHKVKKLDSRAREAIFVGYASSSKGYKLWDEDLRRMVVSRSVRFDESVTDTVDVDTDSETDKKCKRYLLLR